jgi:hypothetical protein
LPFAKYFDDDEIKEKEMDGIHTRSTQEEMINVYRGADKSLPRSGRRQATATEDFEFQVSYLLS